MAEIENQSSKLHAFIVFDAIPPTKEAQDPTIYWFYSQKEQAENFKLNITGLLITFINFCEKWGTSEPCDYIDTKDHEIGLLKLCGPIWMAISLNSPMTNKRSLMSSLLGYCKMMFSHFFVPIPEDDSNFGQNDLKKLISKIPEGFKYIVESINWNSLDITYLYDSYHAQAVQVQLPEGENDINAICQDILNQQPKYFDNIIILYSKHRVIYTTLNPTITRAISFAMRKKFKYMYLHNPICQSEFSWLLGLYADARGMTSIYQQPIYYDGKPHLFVAFKYHKFKIILTIPTDLILSDQTYLEMPSRLKKLNKALKVCYPKPIPFSPIPYTRALNDGNKLTCQSDKFAPKDHQFVHQAFIHLHEISKTYSPTSSSILVPSENHYYILCVHCENAESLVASQKEDEGLYRNLNTCQIIQRLRENSQKQRSVCNIV
ncbi:hypothetical protein TVAG_401980 [Trichomonas vaginalis G3]|uniref:CCZ1/INTU/HSP4 first Longin domain-containing protein n=1 Tax=Trichomonas vaginalis (strain ATCC PRA-98 / G3) TaxID=412133 RepID=A2DHV5_TRIV3|nr:vacuolar fusion protein CCZ1 homolog-related family [Trichomonas vaginalis G3]EAY19944.1 hypothetical protein TVAG_401980 [Trichomonas vaginalis G3]KAI5525894.1 vacuolar fusion protein CCZ1 homolog-related family [Trichomonas vaginalis G3]|eukprot:XP_001580930.1 hypothetical protein [Trichomonas vaginalis G3]